MPWAIAERLASFVTFPRAIAISDYLQTQEKLFKGMRLDQIYKKAREHYSSK